MSTPAARPPNPPADDRRPASPGFTSHGSPPADPPAHPPASKPIAIVSVPPL